MQITFDLPQGKYPKLYRKLRLQMKLDKDATMDDIINKYLKLGFEYERLMQDNDYDDFFKIS
jgi:hypothetical protein